ncbi:MAG: GLPGLI family protein, partial [Flavobacterium sp.]|nr:GLPGLI family protein [Flavobacterium sp.]
MNKIWILIAVFAIQNLWSQKNPNAVKVTYERYSNGELMKQEPIIIFSDVSKTIITNKAIVDKKIKTPFELTQINRTENSILQWTQLHETTAIQTTDSLNLKKQTFEFLEETKTILGYPCKKAKTIINSNTLELWYTTESNLKGSPTLLGQNLGLVLEITRNNNFTIIATGVEKLKTIPENAKIPSVTTKSLDALSY